MLFHGKKIISFLILGLSALHASVVAKVDPQLVYTGETARYTLTISGSDIKKPMIDTLCGSNITATSSSTSIEMINGNYTKTYALSYDFMPQKSCTIAPVSVEVDGKKELSNSVKVTVKPPSQDKNAEFVLSLVPSKKELFVGEPFTLTLTLTQSKRAQIVDSEFVAPDFKGFWIKGQSEPQRTENETSLITTLQYKLAPQREGNLSIKPAQIRIAKRVHSRDMWGSFMPQVKWRSYFSNGVKLQVKPLPNNAKLIGDFTLHVSVDKKVIHPNEAVNVTVRVQGDGNLEDIESFKPYVAGVNVFDEKIVVKGNTLTQKLAFVSDKDFTIPSFHLDFYDIKTKKVRRITTKPIEIKVEGAVPSTQGSQEQLHMQKPQVSEPLHVSAQNNTSSVDWVWLLVSFLIGIGVGVTVVLAKPFSFKPKEKKLNIKDEKILLIKLMEYKDKDEKVQEIVDILEQNIYGSKHQKIDKKVLKEILKKYNIS